MEKMSFRTYVRNLKTWELLESRFLASLRNDIKVNCDTVSKAGKVDPLICPKCQGTMRVISAIDDRQVIRAILEHLGLWLVRSKPPPKAHAPPIREYAACDLQLQTHADTIYGDPEYTWDEYIYPEGHTQS